MRRIHQSKNVLGTDNQQERLRMGYWISGFTDGEGCFAISVIKNPTTHFGKQIFPEFVITQGAKSLAALEMMKKYFGCGSIIVNKRYDNHNENLYRYCVRSIGDLQNKIVPFFRMFPLKTYKANDFRIFQKIIALMERKQHLTEKGWEKVLVLASQMNRKKIRS